MKLRIKKGDLPKIIKYESEQKVRESGCCFRSCGGSPRAQQDDSSINILKSSPIRRFFSKIK